MASLYFGGSFNPIHHGHLICARAVAEALNLARVVLIPSAQPPHKPEAADMAAAEHRLAMCRLAVAGDPFFAVDGLELARSGPSYTLDTARALKERGEKQINWLMGADMLLFLPHWHKPLDLLREINFIVMARPGWQIDWQTLPEPYRVLRHHVVEAPLIDISSTNIRQRIAAGKSIQYLTPPSVAGYIGEQGMYRR